MNLNNIVELFRHFPGAVGHGKSNKLRNDPDFRPQLMEVDKHSTSGYLLKLVKIVGYHPYPFDELLLMASAFQYHKPDIIIDIGTHQGKSARIWFELTQHYGTQTAIHTIDICDPRHPEYPGDGLGKFIRGIPVKQHIGDGYEISSDLIKNDSEANFLIFLDSDHSYENVSRELKLAESIKTGCLLVHDTFYQPGSDYNHGPYLAIQDFLKEHTIKQVIYLETGLPGMSYLGLE